MFSMSRTDDAVKSIAELNIVPVAVSYEWEPCDSAKAVELWKSSQGPYVKKPGEDLQSILSGILSPKGQVHFHICEPIAEEELSALRVKSTSEFHKMVAQIIDRRICGAYRLFPNNYIAHDLLHGSREYAALYSEKEARAFMSRLDVLSRSDGFSGDVRNIFLRIYANPVDSKNL